MKHSNLYPQYKELEAQERRELIAAVKAYGDEYLFVNGPIVLGSRKHDDCCQDFVVSRVKIVDDRLEIYGFENSCGSIDDEALITHIEFSHIGFITDCIAPTVAIKDVSEKS